MAVFYSNWVFKNTATPNSTTLEGTTYYNDVRFKYVTSETVNKAANTSTVTVKKYGVLYDTWGTHTGLTLSSTAYSSNNGGSYYGETQTLTATTSSTDYTYIGTDTYTVSHNDDGTGSCVIRMKGNYTGGSGTVYYSNTITHTATLTTIIRTSTVTSDATASTEFGDTINFTITRQDTDFTHTLTYNMNGQTDTIGTDLTTSSSWEIPVALIEYTPNNAAPYIVVSCTTYSGTKALGTTTYSFQVLVPASYVPTCSLAIQDDNTICAGWGVYVRNKSIITGTITASGSESSTIINYNSTANNQIFFTTPFTTSALRAEAEQTITSTVTDSRGRTAVDSEEITVIDYISPTITTLIVQRCLVDGTLNEQGTYAKATVSFSISPVNDGSSDLNSKSLSVSMGSVTKTATPTTFAETYVFTEYFENIQEAQYYSFSVNLIDAFETTSQMFTMPPATVLISYHTGGDGITLGQVASTSGFNVYTTTRLYGDAYLDKPNLIGTVTVKSGDIYIEYVED